MQSTQLFKGRPGIVDIDDLVGNIPPLLKDRKQWVLYDHSKIPLTIKGTLARVNDATTWSTFNEAIEALKNHPDAIGIGFVFTDDDDLVFIDFDDKPTTPMNETQRELMERFCGDVTDAYIEQSLSGRGRHVICSARDLCRAGAPGGRTPNVEIYPTLRYAAFTGQILQPVTLTGSRDDSVFTYALACATGIAREARERLLANNPDQIQSDESIINCIDRLVSHDYGSNYDTWFKMAAALKHEGATMRQDADYFMNTFVEASRKMTGYISDNDCVKQWFAIKNIKDNPITMGTLNGVVKELDAALAKRTQERLEQRYIEEHRRKQAETVSAADIEAEAQEKPLREESDAPRLLRDPLPGVLAEMTTYFESHALFQNEESAKFYSLMHLTHFASPCYSFDGPHAPLFLNTYNLALQPSGSGKESFARLLDTYLMGVGESAVWLRPMQLPASPQALHHAMAPDPEVPGSRNCDVTITRDEAASFIGNAFGTAKNPGNSDFISYLNQLFSAGRPNGSISGTPSIAGRTSKLFQSPLKEPCANIAFLSQPEAFRRAIKQEAFIGGFMGRFNILVQTETGKRMPYIECRPKPVAPIAVTQFLKKMLDGHKGGARTALKMEPDFGFAWHVHQAMTVDRDSARYGSQWGSNRLSERALKMAGILTIAKGSNVVEFDDYLDAYELLLHWHERFIEFLGGAQVSLDGGMFGVDEAIIKCLKRWKTKGRRYVRAGELRKLCKPFERLDIPQQQQLLDIMLKQGMLAKDGARLFLPDDDTEE